MVVNTGQTGIHFSCRYKMQLVLIVSATC